MNDLKITFNLSEGYKDSLRKKSGNMMKFIVVAKFSTVPLNAEIINPIILDNNPTMIIEIKNNGLCNVLNASENCFGNQIHTFYYQVMTPGNFKIHIFS